MKFFNTLVVATTTASALSLSNYFASFNQQHQQQQQQPEILSLASTKPIPGDSPIELCDAEIKHLVQFDSISITPNPPTAGQNLTFTASGIVDQDIVDGAYVEVDVRYGFIKLIHQTYDLCEDAAPKVDITCPLKKGKQVITKDVEIPQEVPPGKYIVLARAYTKNDELITCLTATIVFPAA